MFVQNTRAVGVTESLDLAPYCSIAARQQGHQTHYQLTAVCDHLGEKATEGHYTAMCKSALHSNWYYCNDDSVRCREDVIVGAPSSLAYLLIYRRQDN